MFGKVASGVDDIDGVHSNAKDATVDDREDRKTQDRDRHVVRFRCDTPD